MNTIIIKAFGILKKEIIILDSKHSIYLPFQKPLSLIGSSPSQADVLRKARFDFLGEYEGELPVYELTEIE